MKNYQNNNIKRGEIYYAELNPVQGSEQGKTRPVIILQNDVGNRYSSTTIVAAITGRKKKKHFPTHVPINIEGLNCASIILLEQIRTIDKHRICGYLGRADEKTMISVDRAIVISFGINQSEVSM